MRLALLILFFMISFHITSSQETNNSLITTENAQFLTPLYIINESFSVGVFSQFEHNSTAVLLVESEVINDRYQSTILTWDLATQEITNTIVFSSNGAIYPPMQIPVYSKFATIGIGGTVALHE